MENVFFVYKFFAGKNSMKLLNQRKFLDKFRMTYKDIGYGYFQYKKFNRKTNNYTGCKLL